MSKLFFHFSVEGFSNTYLLGPESGGEAIVFDPGTFDGNLLELIENNNFYIKHIFITHDHESHIKGLRTMLRVYDAKIYSAGKEVGGFVSEQISDGQTVNAGEYAVTAMNVQGHSSDSMVYRCSDMLFTGDVLSAGRIGETTNEYLQQKLIDEISNKLFVFEKNLYIFPGHGPPTTLDTEKKYNLSLGSECNS